MIKASRDLLEALDGLEKREKEYVKYVLGVIASNLDIEIVGDGEMEEVLMIEEWLYERHIRNVEEDG